MADDLSAPLGRKRAKPAPRLLAAANRLPLARLAVGAAALIVVGVGARILLVSDPTGGRPVAEIGVTGLRNANSLASAVAPDRATITAGPEVPAAALAPVAGGGPDGALDPALANAGGLVAGLLEASEHGAIPRIGASGETPFEAYAEPLPPGAADGRPQIAIVVTGLGLNAGGTAAAIDRLPGPVSLAFAPYGKNLQAVVGAARTAGHEVLLEVPLEPFDYPDSDPGPDTLLTGEAPRENLSRLFTVLGKFGGYVGVINHMGARFTASTADFGPVMEELGSRGLGYVDDGSSARSVAPQLATARSVPFGRADLALDRDPAPQPILDQLQALEDAATRNGSAIGVISALPVSVETLAEWSKDADSRGFTIVPVSALMKKSP